jgi:hypothetical protein
MRKNTPGFSKMKSGVANVAEQKGYGNKNLDKEETYMYSSLNCFLIMGVLFWNTVSNAERVSCSIVNGKIDYEGVPPLNSVVLKNIS